MGATYAVISLGTNTIRLLVVHRGDDGVVEEREHLQAGTRLGEGLRDRGPLAPAAKARTLEAVRTFAAAAQRHDARIACIATSAMRRASDADAFAAELHAVTGAPLEILDGATEAAASFRGATQGMPHDGSRIAVLDIGGGSTECAVGCDGVLAFARSIEIGSVRLTERYAALGGAAPGEPAHATAREVREELRATLAAFTGLGPIDRLIGVAGTALTIGAIALRSDVTRVSGLTLSHAAIDETIDRLLDLPLETRRTLPGMLPQRADVLVAGGLILSETLHAFAMPSVILESNDLLLGFLLAQIDAEGVVS
jgi:exopolyphosphatase/guanosine-5'-triphosphate,3'-diphosphate pyrophosphatase